MATLQERNGSFRVLFCYNGKRETFAIRQGRPPGGGIDRLAG
jgi:hypothetical protein